MHIFWYCPPSVIADFKDPLDNPSFRLRCWYNHINLLKDGFSSHIVDSISKINNPHAVVLMSFGEEEYELAKWVKQKNGVLLHDYTEDIRGIPILEKTKELCDYLVCSSTVLGELEHLQNKVIVIKDPVEEFPIRHNPAHEPDQLKVVWCGMGGNAFWITEVLKPIIEDVGMKYIEISNRPEADIPWDRKDWYINMAEGDIAICPQLWQYPAKSNVKVTTAMGLGLPIIASPIKSYFEVIENGVNGFLAYTFDDWITYLNYFKSKDVRQGFVNNYINCLEQYSIKNIYNQWKVLIK